MKRIVTHLLVATGLAIGAVGAAQAHTDLSIGLSLGVPGYVQAAPVYVQPAPYYQAPPPVWSHRDDRWADRIADVGIVPVGITVTTVTTAGIVAGK